MREKSKKTKEIESRERAKNFKITTKDLSEYPSSVLIDSDTVVATLKYNNFSCSIYVCGNVQVTYAENSEDEEVVYASPREYPEELKQLIFRNHSQRETSVVPWEYDRRVKSTEGSSRTVFSVNIVIDDKEYNVFKKGCNVAGLANKRISNIITNEFENWLDSRLVTAKERIAQGGLSILPANIKSLSEDSLVKTITNYYIMKDFFYLGNESENRKAYHSSYQSIETTLKELLNEYRKRQVVEPSIVKKKRFFFFKKEKTVAI